MENRILSNSVAFVLFALMVLKVSSFHVYTHQDNTQDSVENCAICDLAIENQNQDLIYPTQQVTLSPTGVYLVYEQPVLKNLVVPSFFLRNRFFGRPPPQVG